MYKSTSLTLHIKYYILYFDDIKYQLLANKMIKILVVLVTKIVALFKQTRLFVTDIDIFMHI